MKNKGLNQHRLKQNPLENAYAIAWENENIGRTGRPDGRGYLDYLLAENRNDPMGEVTDRDRVVAATVIQWLGSPVGSSFVQRVLSEFERAQAEQEAEGRCYRCWHKYCDGHCP